MLLTTRFSFSGYEEILESEDELRHVKTELKCEETLFNAIERTGESGQYLMYPSDLCKHMREAWTARLEVASTAYEALSLKTSKWNGGDNTCDPRLWRGHMRRAQYMVQGINVSCKHIYGRSNGPDGPDGMLARASIRKAVSEYALEALGSHGRERFQDSQKWLNRDPVYAEAKRYMEHRQSDYSKLKPYGTTVTAPPPPN